MVVGMWLNTINVLYYLCILGSFGGEKKQKLLEGRGKRAANLLSDIFLDSVWWLPHNAYKVHTLISLILFRRPVSMYLWVTGKVFFKWWRRKWCYVAKVSKKLQISEQHLPEDRHCFPKLSWNRDPLWVSVNDSGWFLFQVSPWFSCARRSYGATWKKVKKGWCLFGSFGKKTKQKLSEGRGKRVANLLANIFLESVSKKQRESLLILGIQPLAGSEAYFIFSLLRVILKYKESLGCWSVRNWWHLRDTIKKRERKGN